MYDTGFIVQIILVGILMGGVYALIALGLTLIFGVMDIINVAHGEFLMLGMYATWFGFSLFHLNPYLSVMITFPLLVMIGVFVFFLCIRPILTAPPINQVLVTVGISVFLQNFAVFAFSPDFRTIDLPFLQNSIILKNIHIDKAKFIAFCVSIVVSGVLYSVLNFTNLGRIIRASAYNRKAARIVGIDVTKTYLITFSIGIGCLGIAGPLVATFYYVSPHVGFVFLIAAFVVVVLGGMGNFVGAWIGGIIIGVAESLGNVYMPGSLGPVITYVIFILIILFKPEGILGGQKL